MCGLQGGEPSNAVHVPNGPGREAAATVAPATFERGRVGCGYLDGLKLVQPDGAHGGNKVLIYDAGISLVRFGRNLRFDMSQPAPEEQRNRGLVRL